MTMSSRLLEKKQRINQVLAYAVIVAGLFVFCFDGSGAFPSIRVYGYIFLLLVSLGYDCRLIVEILICSHAESKEKVRMLVLPLLIAVGWSGQLLMLTVIWSRINRINEMLG
jgi:hypothetical protein